MKDRSSLPQRRKKARRTASWAKFFAVARNIKKKPHEDIDVQVFTNGKALRHEIGKNCVSISVHSNMYFTWRLRNSQA
jgi:hypothetical protein